MALIYASVIKPRQAEDPLATSTSTTPVVATVQPSDAQQKQATEKTGIHIVNGRLTLGNDEASDKFRNFVAGRIGEINHRGPVSYIEPRFEPAPVMHAQAPENASAAAPAPEQSSSSSAVIKSNEQEPNAAAYTETGTVHPAPFVDQVAQDSIDAVTKAVIARKGEGVVKIGRHLDGSAMTEAETQQQIRATLSHIPDEWTITYKSPNEKVRLYVFTDTTCPFCHKLHASMNELLNAGISVHYFLYPRDMGATPAGSLSKTAVNMKNIWCAVDQQAAMNDAFEGYKVPEADCSKLPESLHRRPAPVPDHYLAGSMFNVEATPTWLASNGKHDVGFTNAQTMINALLGH
jgi:hypothetical protein